MDVHTTGWYCSLEMDQQLLKQVELLELLLNVERCLMSKLKWVIGLDMGLSNLQ